ncbi:MAG: penicillin-binding protein beta-lactamase class, partial [Paenibacillus sp.]|nr:penicillin-binding protein beta-lactamase class [Paenibacillus sp.]
MKIGKNSKLFGAILTSLLCVVIALPASVSANTEASATTTLPFVDVEAVSPYFGSITNLYRLNIMEGTGEHTFSPDAPLTRGQFAKLIATAFKPRAYEGPDIFADVAGHWSQPYVMQAYGAGYVEGTGAAAFEPDLPLSGQAAGAILWRILGGKGIAALTSDVSAPAVEADEWAASSIYQLQKLGIWPSSADNKPLPPKQTMTRAQAAVLLDLSIQLFNRMDRNNDSSPDKSRAASSSSTDGSNSSSTGGGNNDSHTSAKPRETGDNRVEAISISSPGEYKSTLSKAWFKLQWPEKRQLLLQSSDAERLMLTDRDGKRIELPADKPLVFTAEANSVYYANGIGSLSVFDGRSMKHAYPLATISEAALLPPIELPPDQTAFFGLTLEAVKHYQFELTGSASSNYNSAVKMLDA